MNTHSQNPLDIRYGFRFDEKIIVQRQINWITKFIENVFGWKVESWTIQKAMGFSIHLLWSTYVCAVRDKVIRLNKVLLIFYFVAFFHFFFIVFREIWHHRWGSLKISSKSIKRWFTQFLNPMPELRVSEIEPMTRMWYTLIRAI